MAPLGANAVLDRLWRRNAASRPQPPSAIPPARPAEPPGSDAARRMAAEAIRCVTAATAGQADELVPRSATLIEALFTLWAEAGLDPVEIWTELHKREQLGSLLMQLNQAHSRAPRRLLRPWKVDSTKLP